MQRCPHFRVLEHCLQMFSMNKRIVYGKQKPWGTYSGTPPFQPPEKAV